MRRFGKGALIAGVAAAVLNAGGAFAGSDPQGEYDPATGEFIKPQQSAQRQMGGKEAFGAIGAKSAEFAMFGAALGPKGAAIGAVLGAGVALFDKGVREGAIKAVANWAQSVGNNTKKIWDGLVSNVMRTFDGIKKNVGSIDWKNILLDTFLPGRGIIRMASEAAGLQAPGENKGWGSEIKDWFAGILGFREAGGPVIKGASYIVGERGPEIFTPGASGSISTNRDLMAMRSGGSSSPSVSANFNVTINLTGGVGSTAQLANELEPAVIAILDKAWNMATASSVSRGALA
jgi:hypothetical protein